MIFYWTIILVKGGQTALEKWDIKTYFNNSKDNVVVHNTTP